MQWIRADLVERYELFEIVTQGRGDTVQWVTSYYVSYGDDDMTWTEIPVLYQANRNSNTKVTNQLPANTIARFIRLNPLTWYRAIALRWDVSGRLPGMLYLRLINFTYCFKPCFYLVCHITTQQIFSRIGALPDQLQTVDFYMRIHN